MLEDRRQRACLAKMLSNLPQGDVRPLVNERCHLALFFLGKDRESVTTRRGRQLFLLQVFSNPASNRADVVAYNICQLLAGGHFRQIRLDDQTPDFLARFFHV